MLDLKGVLLRVLNRIPKDNAVEIIFEKTGWVPSKKPKNKEEIKDRFIDLAALIRPEEVEDFVQMAVMRKNKGLPAYTYRVANLNFLQGLNNDTIMEKYTINNLKFKETFLLSTQLTVENDKLQFDFRLKEYDHIWEAGAFNITELTAVYTSKVTLDLTKRVVTIYNGNHQVQETLFAFISQEFSWPIQSYSLKEFPNQVNEIGGVSFKTALVLDFLSYRLLKNGITSTFKEIKFNLGSRAKKDGIRDVAIGGQALRSSQLACEYITTGSDIISFSTDMTFNGVDFSTKVYLKGPKNDILKIVITETDDEDLRFEAMGIIQSEYIDMCAFGIANLTETKNQLDTIAQKYLNRDQLIHRAIQNSTLQSIKILVDLFPNFEELDDTTLEHLREFVIQNQTILDSIGFDGIDYNLEKLLEATGFSRNLPLDEEDYIEPLSETETID
ncbi:MAG: hypothetical protein KME52_28535 [Desmonostoc geniculatum HA4340-LM1]|jgi:hypothetical protein|nr:hypothetical protein [Desmonostoc geniculatum HA4340-LM1]